jgi:hypothetical protein
MDVIVEETWVVKVKVDDSLTPVVVDRLSVLGVFVLS